MDSSAAPTSLLVELLPWAAGIALGLATLVTGWWFDGRSVDDPDIEPAEGGVFGGLTQPLARMIPDLLPYKARRDMLRCGYYHPTAYDSYLALRNCLVVGMVLSAACWLLAVSDEPNLPAFVLIGGIAATVLAYSLPRLYLGWQGDSRAERIVVGFPDALDVIVMGLTGGLPLQTALDRASDEIHIAHPDLAAELKIVRRQAEAGTLEYALQRFADRVDVEEVSTLTSMVSHAEQMGTPIGAVLRDCADSLRRARMQRAEERGNTVSLKMLFPIVLCMGPATFIVVLAPPLINLKNFRDKEMQPGGILAQPDLSGKGTAPRSRAAASPNAASSSRPNASSPRNPASRRAPAK